MVAWKINAVSLLIRLLLLWGTSEPKSQVQSKKNKQTKVLSPSTTKVDLLCYQWQDSQCGIRTLSSDNTPESQHGAAFTGGGHTLLPVSPWAKPARELVINRRKTSGCYCFPCWWRKSIIIQGSLWCSVSFVCVCEGCPRMFPSVVSVNGRWMHSKWWLYNRILCSIWDVLSHFVTVCSPVSHCLQQSTLTFSQTVVYSKSLVLSH